jgi:hypothetical protein
MDNNVEIMLNPEKFGYYKIRNVTNFWSMFTVWVLLRALVFYRY